jgi:hypothetical protein
VETAATLESQSVKVFEPSVDSTTHLGGYDPSFFDQLASVEEQHFWSRSRNRLIFEISKRSSSTQEFRIVPIANGIMTVLLNLEARWLPSHRASPLLRSSKGGRKACIALPRIRLARDGLDRSEAWKQVNLRVKQGRRGSLLICNFCQKSRRLFMDGKQMKVHAM